MICGHIKQYSSNSEASQNDSIQESEDDLLLELEMNQLEQKMNHLLTIIPKVSTIQFFPNINKNNAVLSQSLCSDSQDSNETVFSFSSPPTSPPKHPHPQPNASPHPKEPYHVLPSYPPNPPPSFKPSTTPLHRTVPLPSTTSPLPSSPPPSDLPSSRLLFSRVSENQEYMRGYLRKKESESSDVLISHSSSPSLHPHPKASPRPHTPPKAAMEISTLSSAPYGRSSHQRQEGERRTFSPKTQAPIDSTKQRALRREASLQRFQELLRPSSSPPPSSILSSSKIPAMEKLREKICFYRESNFVLSGLLPEDKDEVLSFKKESSVYSASDAVTGKVRRVNLLPARSSRGDRVDESVLHETERNGEETGRGGEEPGRGGEETGRRGEETGRGREETGRGRESKRFASMSHRSPSAVSLQQLRGRGGEEDAIDAILSGRNIGPSAPKNMDEISMSDPVFEPYKSLSQVPFLSSLSLHNQPQTPYIPFQPSSDDSLHLSSTGHPLPSHQQWLEDHHEDSLRRRDITYRGGEDLFQQAEEQLSYRGEENATRGAEDADGGGGGSSRLREVTFSRGGEDASSAYYEGGERRSGRIMSARGGFFYPKTFSQRDELLTPSGKSVIATPPIFTPSPITPKHRPTPSLSAAPLITGYSPLELPHSSLLPFTSPSGPFFSPLLGRRKGDTMSVCSASTIRDYVSGERPFPTRSEEDMSVIGVKKVSLRQLLGEKKKEEQRTGYLPSFSTQDTLEEAGSVIHATRPPPSSYKKPTRRTIVLST